MQPALRWAVRTFGDQGPRIQKMSRNESSQNEVEDVRTPKENVFRLPISPTKVG